MSKCRPDVPVELRISISESHAEIERCQKTIWSQAYRWHRKNRDIDIEDIHQEIVLGWMHAVRRYARTSPYPFGAFAYMWGEHFARRFITSQVAKNFTGTGVGKRGDPNRHKMRRIETSRLVSRFHDGRDDAIHPSIVDACDDGETWEAVRRHVSESDWSIIEQMYRDGLNGQQIAEQRGVTRQCIHQHMARIFRRLGECRWMRDAASA